MRRYWCCLLGVEVAALFLLTTARGSSNITKDQLRLWNTLHTPETDALDRYARHRRQLLVSAGSCACLCAGTHEGYVQATTENQCTASACVGSFPSCSWGEASAKYWDGSLPSGKGSGVITLQSVRPDNCQQAIIGATCAQQYQFLVADGFIQLISTSSDACVPGSAQQSIAYKTRNTLAAGHFVGNINNSAFTLANADGGVTMNLNQGCILTYKVSSGGPLLGASAGGKCFPASSTVHTRQGAVVMSDLQLGSEVLTAAGNGALLYEPVFMFSHQDRLTVSDFLAITTASGHRITSSPSHYLWVSRAVQPPDESHSDKGLTRRRQAARIQPQGAEVVKASDVSLGNTLWVKSLDGRAMMGSEVVSVAREVQTGLFNPHTASGSLVVDGVAALSFTDSLPGSGMLHALLTSPARVLYAVLPSHVAAGLNSAVLKMIFG